ncbi:hypothetical protein K1719_018637 [Acacia pycnantha]|nr:hypothetical protein K1719_018637 [Acacia pycnantha]
MWRPKDPLKIIPVNSGYYIVSFSNKEDREYAFQEGPWMIEDHYLILQRWRPSFNPWKADLQCNITAWIRLRNISFEFYNIDSLHIIGNMIGKMIKVFGEERPIIYEGLHQVCFMCGKYGHRKDNCPMKQEDERTVEKKKEEAETGDSGGVKLKKEQGVKVGGGATIVTGDVNSDTSPFGKIQILRRDFCGPPSKAILAYVINGQLKQNDATRKKSDIMEAHQLVTEKDKKMTLNANKKELIKDHGPQKLEWVQQMGASSSQAEDAPRIAETSNSVGEENADVVVSHAPLVSPTLDGYASTSSPRV